MSVVLTVVATLVAPLAYLLMGRGTGDRYRLAAMMMQTGADLVVPTLLMLVGLALLLGTFDDETGPFSILLGNLLLLNGPCELLSESHVSNRDVLECDVELPSTLHQVGTDAVGDSLTLCDEIGGVELGHNGLEDFVSDGGENTLIIIGTIGLGK